MGLREKSGRRWECLPISKREDTLSGVLSDTERTTEGGEPKRRRRMTGVLLHVDVSAWTRVR